MIHICVSKLPSLQFQFFTDNCDMVSISITLAGVTYTSCQIIYNSNIGYFGCQHLLNMVTNLRDACYHWLFKELCYILPHIVLPPTSVLPTTLCVTYNSLCYTNSLLLFPLVLPSLPAYVIANTYVTPTLKVSLTPCYEVFATIVTLYV